MPFIRANDLEIYYTERGEGPTVIALHAATVSSLELGWLSRAVVHEGFNIITPDLRGHGQTANRAPDLHMSRLVDDLLEFAFLLGRTPVHVMGYSLGGAIALYAARQRPDLFRSLVLLGTNFRAPTQERILSVLGPEERRPRIQQQVFHAQDGAVAGWNLPPKEFSRITCPALIVSGDRDEFNDAEDQISLYRAIPQSEVLIIPHADHLGLVKHPMVFRALLDFYGRVPR